MCGRYVSPEESDLERYSAFRMRMGRSFRSPERIYNAAPTMLLPVVRLADGEPTLESMQWGFIPAWWKKEELPSSTINARSEDAAAKPMWRDAVRRSRCLVPALGYYEWQAGTPRQPWFVHLPGRELFFFAGVWSQWAPPGGDPFFTFAILTRAAAPALAAIHARMPVVLPPPAFGAWLDPKRQDGAELLAWANEQAVAAFEAYPVTSYVNSPRNQGERCIAPA